MVGVKLGAKAKNYDFDVSDVDLDAIKGNSPSYTITAKGLTIAESKSDYVMLQGQFKLWSLMEGDYAKGIRSLDSITVVEHGKISYQATGLDMTGKEVANGSLFKDFLSGENYAIKGNNFANEITGADQRDVILGYGGNDTLDGLGGNDKLIGNIGNDRLIGGLGNDRMTGGTGTDTFIFAAGDGSDTITDFKAFGRGHDLIDLSGHEGVSSFGDLVISRSGSSVRVEVGEDTILLQHVSLARIDADDFLF